LVTFRAENTSRQEIFRDKIKKIRENLVYWAYYSTFTYIEH